MSESLPDWATKRCHDCGELFLPGFGCVWSSRQPDRWTHGGLKYCEAQTAYLARQDVLALQVIVMHQAFVEAGDVLQRFISEADEENWNEEVATAIFAALHSIERGERVDKQLAHRCRVNHARVAQKAEQPPCKRQARVQFPPRALREENG